MKTKVLAAAFFIAVIISILPASYGQAQSQYQTEVVRGKVLSVQDLPPRANQEEIIAKVQVAEVEFISGSLAGETYTIQNSLTGHPLYDMDLQAGQKIYLLVEKLDGEILSVSVNDYVRDTKLYWLIGAFALVMIAVGRLKGLRALISLAVTMLLIVYVFLPMLLEGGSPLLLSVALAVAVTVVTLLLIGGINGKTAAAAFGTTGGVLIAGMLAMFMGRVAHLTGFSSEEAQMLQFAQLPVDVRGLLFAGIIIGSLGAVMDVAVSIASTCCEVKKVNPGLGWKEVFQSGMNVGRDVMGTMTNTLILAYAGSSLPLLLLFVINGLPWARILNTDLIATEVVRALTGTMGLLAAIPLTALAAAFFYNNRPVQPEPGDVAAGGETIAS